MVVVHVMALVRGEDHRDQVLLRALDRARRDVEPVERGALEQAALAEVPPDGQLVLEEAGLEGFDVLRPDVQDDGDGLHGPGSSARVASVRPLDAGRRTRWRESAIRATMDAWPA